MTTPNIEITEVFGLVLVTVNGTDYAVFQDTQLEELDQAIVIQWVVNTYYDEDYKLDQYIAPNLNKYSFGASLG